MIRKLWPLLAAAVVFAATAQAQVAAPELVPAAPRLVFPGLLSFDGGTVTPDNPAALQWAMTSGFAFSLAQHTTEIAPGSTLDYDGWLVGYRGISDRFAFGLEHFSLSQGNGSNAESATSAHVSMQVLDGLAIGAGLDRSEFDTGASSQQNEENTLGFSVNLAKQFYLGYAIGSDKYEDSGGLTGSRGTTLYGIAFRTEGNWRWHLAYDALDKDNFDNGVGNGFDAATITVQAGVGNWVFGVQSVDFSYKGGGGDVSSTVVDLGWVPEKAGLSVTLRLWDGGFSTTVPLPIDTNDTGAAVNIAYRF